MKLILPLKSKLLMPCKKLLLRTIKFKLRIRKPFFLRRVVLYHRRRKQQPSHGGLSKILSILRLRKRSMETTRTIKSSLSELHYERAPCPSPLTPAYIKLSRPERSDQVEDACRSFENYLVEMIVEEGKMKDLVDVEELLRCWKDLKSPLFLDLVCRFYRELCKDLFIENAS
ncbi:transcription repressor OFP17 [Andrographis paniculata]|uniref:transcription repressor OFP17 n=1 Tax=Andrographis paniculata TaxID=175694 RepID=UPI0021E91FE3|nr:transcription repressor OFP17 [Andrographis paniculata]